VYGLVNKAIEDLALSIGGEPVWQAIVARSGLDVVSFVSLDNYDDEITYRLVEAASVELGMTPEQVLEGFGEHWVRYTGRAGYGPLMGSFGSDVGSFLHNLDSLHARITLMMPQLRPPSFTVEELGPDRFVVHYRSARQGLAPMVTGLLRGVGALFDQQVAVTRLARAEDGADHDVFELVVSPAPAGTGPADAPAHTVSTDTSVSV